MYDVIIRAEIYHQARGLATSSLRPGFVAINAAVYGVQVCVCVCWGGGMCG